MFFKIRRWFSVASLKRQGARMFDCRTAINRRLYLREHYWLNRIHGFPHALALYWAIRQTVSHTRMDQSSDRLERTFTDLVGFLTQGAEPDVGK